MMNYMFLGSFLQRLVLKSIAVSAFLPTFATGKPRIW